MNRYVKEYITRGLIFAGFGPIVLGIIYSFLQAFDANFKLAIVPYLELYQPI